MFCTCKYDASQFFRIVLASDNVPTREKVICGLVYSYIHTRGHVNAQTREYDFYGEIICLASPRVYFPGVLASIGYRACLIPCMYIKKFIEAFSDLKQGFDEKLLQYELCFNFLIINKSDCKHTVLEKNKRSHTKLTAHKSMDE